MPNTELLTKDEMDALLHEVERGSLPPESGNQCPLAEPVPYSFTTQEHITRGPMPLIEMLYDRFARHLNSSLYDLLRRETRAALGGLVSLKFSEYFAGLQPHCSFHVAKVRPLGGFILFVIEPGLVFSIVNSYFGGDAEPPPQDSRSELRPSEFRIARMIIGKACRDLEHAWEPAHKIILDAESEPSNPLLANLFSAADVVVVARIHFDFGNHGGEMHVVMPQSFSEPINEALDPGINRDRGDTQIRWRQQVENTLNEVQVELDATFVETEVPLREVLHLKPGAIIPVDVPEQISLRVAGVAIFEGAFAVARGRNSIKINRTNVTEDNPAARKAVQGAARE